MRRPPTHATSTSASPAPIRSRSTPTTSRSRATARGPMPMAYTGGPPRRFDRRVDVAIVPAVGEQHDARDGTSAVALADRLKRRAEARAAIASPRAPTVPPEPAARRSARAPGESRMPARASGRDRPCRARDRYGGPRRRPRATCSSTRRRGPARWRPSCPTSWTRHGTHETDHEPDERDESERRKNRSSCRWNRNTTVGVPGDQGGRGRDERDRPPGQGVREGHSQRFASDSK